MKRIVFRQKKTKNLEYLDVNEQAAALMGNRADNNSRVFVGLKYSAQMNIELQRWCLTAGISKKIFCGFCETSAPNSNSTTVISEM